MNHFKRTSAEHMDIHRRLLILVMFLLSLISACKTLLYVVPENWHAFFRTAAIVLAIFIAITLVTTVFWKWRFIPIRDMHLLSSPDHFVNEVMNRAFKTSWLLTLVLLEVMVTMTNKNDRDQPTEFYLYLVLAFMLGVFSISFFVQYWRNSHDKQTEEGL